MNINFILTAGFKVDIFRYSTLQWNTFDSMVTFQFLKNMSTVDIWYVPPPYQWILITFDLSLFIPNVFY